MLYFWSSGNIGEFFPPASGFPLSQPSDCFCLSPTIPTPCFFSRQRAPTHALPKGPGTLLHPSSLLCQTRSPDTPGRRGEGRKGWYFHPSGSGTAGVRRAGGWGVRKVSGRDVDVGKKPRLPSGTKPSAEINIGMGARRVAAAAATTEHGQAGWGLLCMDLESREDVRDAYLRRTRSISPTGLFSQIFPTRAHGGNPDLK